MQAADTHTTPDPATAAEGACLVAPRLADDKAQAWVGFLAAHAEITRALDGALSAEFGLSLSALEVLSRIAWQEQGRMRMSDLAVGALLSQSRVSRLVDQLESRGLVQRVTCASDSRGVYASITDSGRELIARALPRHWEAVDERFFARLSAGQVEQLGAIWHAMLGRRIGGPETGACPTG